jgi:hypothetical protein
MTQQTMFGVTTPSIPIPEDWDRWNGHNKEMFEALRSGLWQDRDYLEARVRTKNFTARISNLRQRGYEIECERSNRSGATVYRMTGYVGKSTTRGGHCPSCTCGDS